MEKKEDLSRRRFISNTAMATIGTLGASSLLNSCSGEKNKKELIKPFELLTQAPDGKVLKAGLIGCGGRGTGAAINFLDAGPNLEIVALGDVFQDRIDKCRAELKARKNVDIPDEKCFLGF
ncbi:MAG: oxidoreductase, partial [Bacteroidales bacterium]|nr:oxidoreductase [Bacteroidales bacterium]